jgi:hypothetical protein
MKKLITVLTALLLGSCSGANSDPPPAPTPPSGQNNGPALNNIEPPGPSGTVQPGESVRELGPIAYSDSGGHGNSGPDRIGMCRLVLNGHALAILEFETGIEELVKVESDCSGPYAAGAYKYRVNTLAVAGGTELPRSFQLVVVGIEVFTGAEPGDVILAQLRELDGEWFLDANLRAELGRDELIEDQLHIDVPGQFEELSKEAVERFDAFAEHCPDHVDLLANDDVWRRFLKDPSYRGCVPWDEEGECDRPDCRPRE